MSRTIIQLRPDQQDRLRAMARSRNTSISELVRQGVDCVLAREMPASDRKSRALAVSGMLSSGSPSDLSESHDDYAFED